MNGGMGKITWEEHHGHPLCTVHFQNDWKHDKTFFRWPPHPRPCLMSSETITVEEYEAYKI